MRLQALSDRLLAATTLHIAGNVAPVNVQTSAQYRQEQALYTATQIKRRLAKDLDLLLEKRHLRGIGAKLGGPLSNQTIEPGHGIISHRYIFISPPVVAG